MKLDFAGALRRRWYLVLLGLLLTSMLGYGALRVVGVTYEAKAMLLLLPPGATVPKAGNPYLNLGSMQPVVGVLANSMQSQQTARTVRDVSPSATFTVAPDPTTSGSVLIIDVTDHTSNGARDVLKTLTTLAPQRLDQLQKAADTPATGRITTDLVAEDTKPVVSHKRQQRAGLLAVAFGLAATVLGASFIDGWATRRGKRRTAKRSVDEVATGRQAGPVPSNQSPATPDEPGHRPDAPTAEAGDGQEAPVGAQAASRMSSRS